MVWVGGGEGGTRREEKKGKATQLFVIGEERLDGRRSSQRAVERIESVEAVLGTARCECSCCCSGGGRCAVVSIFGRLGVSAGTSRRCLCSLADHLTSLADADVRDVEGRERKKERGTQRGAGRARGKGAGTGNNGGSAGAGAGVPRLAALRCLVAAGRVCGCENRVAHRVYGTFEARGTTHLDHIRLILSIRSIKGKGSAHRIASSPIAPNTTPTLDAP